MQDRELVAAIVAGDPGRLDEAYDRYAAPLYAYCRSMLTGPDAPGEAASAVEDTFIIAAVKLQVLGDPDQLGSWLHAVARNECLRRPGALDRPGPPGTGLTGTGLTGTGLTGTGREHFEFVTSDLGFVADGRVVVRGRADDVINTGGHKVIPGEVAAALSDCPGVREVVVIGRPDPEWGERVTAVVVPADPEDPPGLQLLRTHVRTKLPRYACPSEVVLTEAIPVLPSGKPDLAALKVART
jgi:acyl-CoA synthetase (AMP-forming)/AMP-acid ligase II